MSKSDTSRRDFLQKSAALAGSTWFRLSAPGLAAISQAACSAKEEAREFIILSENEAREFEAIAARILPTTETPGAREAGVIWFFDQTFGTFNAKHLADARKGLAAFQDALQGDALFSSLGEDEQDAHLRAHEQGAFFNLMRTMTLYGFFGMSKYGGNKDDIGWKLVDMNPDEHIFHSPFGYYDAEYMKEKAGA